MIESEAVSSRIHDDTGQDPHGNESSVLRGYMRDSQHEPHRRGSSLATQLNSMINTRLRECVKLVHAH